jgi:hypothetical protein
LNVLNGLEVALGEPPALLLDFEPAENDPPPVWPIATAGRNARRRGPSPQIVPGTWVPSVPEQL